MNKYEDALDARARYDGMTFSDETEAEQVYGAIISDHDATIRQALSAMSQLTEARKEATGGEWHKVGLPWNYASPYIIAGHHDPHVGKAIIDVMEDDEDLERQAQQQYEYEQETNCDFICLAANLTRED